jgi:hypothetical protein
MIQRRFLNLQKINLIIFDKNNTIWFGKYRNTNALVSNTRVKNKKLEKYLSPINKISKVHYI